MGEGGREGWSKSRWLVGAAGVFSAIYFILAVRFGWRIAAHNNLHPQTRGYFVGALVTTIVLYGVGLAVAFSERHRAGSLIPVVGAAIFGSFLCTIFYGP